MAWIVWVSFKNLVCSVTGKPFSAISSKFWLQINTFCEKQMSKSLEGVFIFRCKKTLLVHFIYTMLIFLPSNVILWIFNTVVRLIGILEKYISYYTPEFFVKLRLIHNLNFTPFSCWLYCTSTSKLLLKERAWHWRSQNL